MKEFNPLVSVVIPVYNGSKYIKEALESVFSQTYKNIEIIVVNDGSIDNSEEIINKYNDKIRYFKKPNGGVASALNFAISNSNGEYISWLSHDDLYSNNKIESEINLLKSLEVNDREKTIIYTNYKTINENSVVINASIFHKQHNLKNLNSSLYPLFKGLIHGCTLLIPKKCFSEIRYFDENLKATQDYDLWFKMFPSYDIRFLESYSVMSRTHKDQDSKKSNSVEECNKLWIKMVSGISRENMILISGAELKFYKETFEIVSNAGYEGAADYLKERIESFCNKNLNEILVTIIMPFYNRIDWVLNAIKSVQIQTHKNLELILINDNSNENLDRINLLIQSDKRIKLITNKKNLGAARSRNIGIEIARGEYIAFLDSDDIFKSKKIYNQLEFMLSEKSLISHTSYELVDENLESIEVIKSGVFNYNFPETIKSCSIATPTVMVHKDIFSNKLMRFPEDFKIGEDICLWINISSEFQINGLQSVLTQVRRHENQTILDDNKMIIGLNNIVHYSIENFINESSAESIISLNNSLQNLLARKYSVDLSDLNYLGRYSKLKKLIKKILLLLPTYRKLQTLQYSIVDNNNKISDLTKQIDGVITNNYKEKKELRIKLDENLKKIIKLLE